MSLGAVGGDLGVTVLGVAAYAGRLAVTGRYEARHAGQVSYWLPGACIRAGCDCRTRLVGMVAGSSDRSYGRPGEVRRAW